MVVVEGTVVSAVVIVVIVVVEALIVVLSPVVSADQVSSDRGTTRTSGRSSSIRTVFTGLCTRRRATAGGRVHLHLPDTSWRPG